MLQNLQAEILFPDPDYMLPADAALTELGFEVELLPRIDECSDAVWIRARIAAEFADEDHFLGWVVNIVEPLHGEVVEAGFAD